MVDDDTAIVMLMAVVHHATVIERTVVLMLNKVVMAMLNNIVMAVFVAMLAERVGRPASNNMKVSSIMMQCGIPRFEHILSGVI